tara:strand:+ start:1183 stop:1494 length:312 start_codon:yes stop_codon:yes gene_type:complete
MNTTTEAVSSNPVLLIDTAPNDPYTFLKEDLELFTKKLNYLLIYLLEKESYVNSLIDFESGDPDLNEQFEDISTMFHRATMSVEELMSVKNQLKGHIPNKEEN